MGEVTQCEMGVEELARKVTSLPYTFLYKQNCNFPICIHEHLSLSCNSLKIKDNSNLERSSSLNSLNATKKYFFRSTFVL